VRRPRRLGWNVQPELLSDSYSGWVTVSSRRTGCEKLTIETTIGNVGSIIRYKNTRVIYRYSFQYPNLSRPSPRQPNSSRNCHYYNETNEPTPEIPYVFIDSAQEANQSKQPKNRQ